MDIALYVVAGLLELVGLLFAWVGFRQTWAEFGAKDMSMRAATLAPVAKQVRRSGTATRKVVARLVRRKPRESQTVQVRAAHDTAWATDSVSARVTFGDLPHVADADALLAEVHRRIQTVHAMAQETRDGLAFETRARGPLTAAFGTRSSTRSCA